MKFVKIFVSGAVGWKWRCYYKERHIRPTYIYIYKIDSTLPNPMKNIFLGQKLCIAFPFQRIIYICIYHRLKSKFSTTCLSLDDYHAAVIFIKLYPKRSSYSRFILHRIELVEFEKCLIVDNTFEDWKTQVVWKDISLYFPIRDIFSNDRLKNEDVFDNKL